MMPELRIQQAIVLSDVRGVKVVASTEGLDIPEVERIAVLFGQRPPGVACPLAHFACPFGKRYVAVVRVEDRPGSENILGFHFLILYRDLYRHLGDPFAISDRFPVNWTTGTLPELVWPAQPLPERALEHLDHILKNGDGPLLLGATQALVDGNRVLLMGTAPNEAFVRDLWRLLPTSSQRELWPASFAFSNELRFHLAIGPTFQSADRMRQLTEDALRDYPPGNYELNLQIAVESGDRASLRRLLARRSSDETLRLGLYMVAFALIVAVLFRFVI
jgi:hypothetical protein